MSSLTYQQEVLTHELRHELMPLLQAHKDEISIFDEPLSVDWSVYFGLQNVDILRAYTCRADGELVGYAVYLLQYHPHYSQTSCAVQDVLFLSETHRKGLTGIRLIRYSEEQLRWEGVSVVMQHTKQRKDLTRLLGRMGYEVCDIIMTKRL